MMDFLRNCYETFNGWREWCNKSNFNMYASVFFGLFTLIGLYEFTLTVASFF